MRTIRAHRQTRFANCDFDRVPNRGTALNGQFFQRIRCRFADSARRRIDNTQQVDRVVRIQSYRQIADQVLDLARS